MQTRPSLPSGNLPQPGARGNTLHLSMGGVMVVQIRVLAVAVMVGAGAAALASCGTAPADSATPTTAATPRASATPTMRAASLAPNPYSTDLPQVLRALNCDSIEPADFAALCNRNGRTGFLFFGPVTEDTIRHVVRGTIADGTYEAGDTFFTVPDGVLYLPAEFARESAALAEPDDPYNATVVDTDQYK